MSPVDARRKSSRPRRPPHTSSMSPEAGRETSGSTWRVTAKTRRDLLDMLTVDRFDWWGRLDDVGFLERVWDLSAMPSTDHRFKDAAGDIWQHRVNNPEDWSDEWVYSDSRFDLVHGDDQHFLAFLCETVHPIVRADADEARKLVEVYNDYLLKDGVQLVPVDKLGSRSVYEARFRSQPLTPTSAFKFDKYPLLSDPGVLHDQLRRIDHSLDDDPAVAIGASKELVESVCRIILADYGEHPPKKTDLPDLYKKTAKELRLSAEDIPASAKGSRAAQMTLRTLATTIQSLADYAMNWARATVALRESCFRSAREIGIPRHRRRDGLPPCHLARASQRFDRLTRKAHVTHRARDALRRGRDRRGPRGFRGPRAICRHGS